MKKPGGPLAAGLFHETDGRVCPVLTSLPEVSDLSECNPGQIGFKPQPRLASGTKSRSGEPV